MTSMFKNFPILLVSLLLTSCGGGGGGNPAAPPPPAAPPAPLPPVGCSATVSSGPFTEAWPNAWQSRQPESQGICPDEISAAFDYAFAASNDTGATLVIKNGYIVAERYDATKSATDLVTSWSVAKSITSALVGKALDEGHIQGLDQSLADFIPGWAGTAKANITLHHLLTVRTALELLGDDDGDGIPDGAGLYNDPDALALSLARPLIGNPGEKLYTYSNSDVMIAGEVVSAATGSPIPPPPTKPGTAGRQTARTSRT